MINLNQIETAVRAQRGSWQTLFRRQGAGWHCILFPARMLSPDDYQTLARRLNAPESQELTPAELQRNKLRNKLRALADASDAGDRRYGR